MSILSTTDAQHYFDVIDGWGGNLDQGAVASDSIVVDDAHKYATSGTSPLKRGAIVIASGSAGAPKCVVPLVDANVNLTADKAAPKRFWMVVEGNTEFDYSGRFMNKVVCIRGSFAVETAHVKGTPSIGDALTVEHGTAGTVDAAHPHQTISSVPGINEGRLAVAASGDPVLGRVVDIKTVDSTTVYVVEMNF